LTLDGEVYDAERLVASTREDAALRAGNPGADTRSYLIERRIRQHPELTALVGQTLCCIRVQTIVTLGGSRGSSRRSASSSLAPWGSIT
jgi:hypothetical protein